MNCKECHTSNSQETEQYINGLVEYLTAIGVSTESMIASQIAIEERAKYLTTPPTPFKKENK